MKSAITSKELGILPMTVDWYSSSTIAKKVPSIKHNKAGNLVFLNKLLNKKRPKRKYSIICNNLSTLKKDRLEILLPEIEDTNIIDKRNIIVK